MKQNALTLITPVDEQHIASLKKVLKDRKDDLKTALRSIGTIHYARWVIIDGETLDNEVLPAQLVFASNFDGDVLIHIQDLIKHLGTLLDDIYKNTTDYNPHSKVEFLVKTRIKEAAFYQGSPGRTVVEIAREKALHQELFNQIRAGNWEGKSARQIHEILQTKVLAMPQFAWAKEKVKVPRINILGLIVCFTVLLVLSPILILWAVYIQVFHENFDKPLNETPNQLDDKHINDMQADEDYEFQNQFSQIINMKPGKARLITVNGLYLLTRVLIKLMFVKGKLMGIPTIHFARWIQVNNKRRMLFFSNFDGSWTQYLGDFIDKSGWGLTGIFGNTEGFPRSLFLIFKGAYDERHFLAWSRKWQIKTQFWYAADTSQSIKNINNNTLIRNELSQSLSESKAKIFLARI